MREVQIREIHVLFIATIPSKMSGWKWPQCCIDGIIILICSNIMVFYTQSVTVMIQEATLLNDIISNKIVGWDHQFTKDFIRYFSFQFILNIFQEDLSEFYESKDEYLKAFKKITHDSFILILPQLMFESSDYFDVYAAHWKRCKDQVDVPFTKINWFSSFYSTMSIHLFVVFSPIHLIVSISSNCQCLHCAQHVFFVWYEIEMSFIFIVYFIRRALSLSIPKLIKLL